MKIIITILLLSLGFSTTVIFETNSGVTNWASLNGIDFRISNGKFMELPYGNYYLVVHDKDYDNNRKVSSQFFKVIDDNDLIIKY